VEGVLFGKIYVLLLSCPPAVHHLPIPFTGLYSGIFALYCYVRAKSTDSTEKSGTNNIVFYGLCTLYVGTFITLVFDIQNIAIEQQVSDNSIPIPSVLEKTALISCIVHQHICERLVQSFRYFKHNRCLLRLYFSICPGTLNQPWFNLSFDSFNSFIDLPLLDCME
jgi:hypothetical protein